MLHKTQQSRLFLDAFNGTLRFNYFVLLEVAALLPRYRTFLGKSLNSVERQKGKTFVGRF